jgi:hypothetical protein
LVASGLELQVHPFVAAAACKTVVGAQAMKRARAFVVVAAFVGIASAAASQPAASTDAPLAEVEALLKAARAEIAQFERDGGKRTDPHHPVSVWVEKLWALRELQPPSAATGKATAEAIHLLVHADRVPDAEAKADRLALDDRAWDPKALAALHFYLGRGHAKTGNTEAARASLKAA